MTVKVDLSGFDDAEHRFRVLSIWLQETAAKAMRLMIASMTGQKSGRVYKIGKNRTHQASAPGQAPAVQSGVLKSSITINPVNEYTYVISIAAFYGRILEFSMNRAFAIPASEKAWAVFTGVVRKYFNG